MRRRQFICFLGSVFFVCPCVALAQQSAKQPRIGRLSAGSPDTPAAAKYLQAFRQNLEHLGHIEGRDLAIELRYAHVNFDRLPSLGAELVDQKMDIIVTLATQAAVAARKATSTISIVAISATDPVARGLVESLARRGGNVTGLALSVGLDIFSKGPGLLREAVPGLQTVELLVDPANPFHAAAASQLEAAALALNVHGSVVQARQPEDIATAFEAIAQAQYGAVFVVADTLFFAKSAQIAKLALKYQVPSMHQLRGERANVLWGRLHGPGSSLSHVRGRHFRGAPADLPVQQPTKFELVINLNTARTLGLTISPTLLVRLDEVIE